MHSWCNTSIHTMKMTQALTVFVLLQLIILQVKASPAPTTSLQDDDLINIEATPIDTSEIPLNPLLQEIVPPLSSNATSVYPGSQIQQRELKMSTRSIYSDINNLKWVTWQGFVPSGAAGIYNSYAGRTDYICKYGCSSGFYSPKKGSYCYYPLSDKEYRSSYFDILVNVDNFEILNWQGGSWGSVPRNSVKVCSDVYVGKNKYGLGKVVPRHKAFFLPWEGKEYWYKNYEVYTVNRQQYNQQISNVQYRVNQMNKVPRPSFTLKNSTVNNCNCEAVINTVQMEVTSERVSTFEISRSNSLAISTSITAGIPLISETVSLTAEKTFSITQSSTIRETVSHFVSVENITVSPNHSCTVRMEGTQYTVSIPFTARLTKTYTNGVTRSTAISGTYKGAQVSKVIAVVDRCQPITNAAPCP